VSKWIPVPENFIEVDPEKCTGCGNCIVVCGGQVFEMKGEKAIVTHMEQCLECGNCEVACLSDALRFHVPKGGTGIVYTCG